MPMEENFDAVIFILRVLSIILIEPLQFALTHIYIVYRVFFSVLRAIHYILLSSLKCIVNKQWQFYVRKHA